MAVPQQVLQSQTDFSKHSFSYKRNRGAENLAITYATPPISPSAHIQSALEASLVSLKGHSLGMDSNDPRRRQSNPPGYASQQGLLQTSPQYPVTSAVDRYRSSQLGTQLPTSAPSTGRGGSVQGYNYGYGENTSFAGSSMNPATLAYQSEYAQEPQRQPHPYGQYGSSLMYNAPQLPTQSPYEPVQQYQQPRQSSAIEVMTNQFAVPQQQYYGASESGPTIAPMSALGSQNNPTQYPQMSYSQQSAAPREQVLSAYGMAEASQSSQATYGQGQPGYSSSELDSAYGQYQAELKKTFASIRDGRMVDAGSSLVSISEWLLGNAETLGRLLRVRICFVPH